MNLSYKMVLTTVITLGILALAQDAQACRRSGGGYYGGGFSPINSSPSYNGGGYPSDSSYSQPQPYEQGPGDYTQPQPTEQAPNGQTASGGDPDACDRLFKDRGAP